MARREPRRHLKVGNHADKLNNVIKFKKKYYYFAESHHSCLLIFHSVQGQEVLADTVTQPGLENVLSVGKNETISSYQLP